MYATIQVDLDGLWTIYQHHQVDISHYPDPVFEQSISRFLDLFRVAKIQSTFFIIGRDLEISEVADRVKQIADSGHELANHSYSHPRNFSALSYAEKKNEIERANNLISKISGQAISGFRAPSYAIDSETLTILDDLQYVYDSSILPTYWSGLIRLIESDRSMRHSKPSANYGKIQYSKAPHRIYHPEAKYPWKQGDLTLWEVPVSVYPLIRTPIHSSFSARFGWWYFASGIKWLARLKRPVVFVFHGVDLVDRFQDKRIPRIKWVQESVEKRMDLFQKMLGNIAAQYQIIPTKEFVNAHNSNSR